MLKSRLKTAPNLKGFLLDFWHDERGGKEVVVGLIVLAVIGIPAIIFLRGLVFGLF